MQKNTIIIVIIIIVKDSFIKAAVTQCFYLLLWLLDFFFPNLFTDGRLFHTEDISTPLSQLFQAALDIQTRSINFILSLSVSDAAVSLLQPAWI